MSDVKPLEHEVRRALRATADALAVEEREFDAGHATTIVDATDPLRVRRPQRTLALAAAMLVVFVAAGVVIRQTTQSSGGVHVADASTTTAPATTAPTVTTAPTPTTVPPPAVLASQVASVPVSVLDQVGAGTSTPRPASLPGPVLTDNGKPRIVWIGAEYCPYCAAERWPLILALSRFGTFADLGVSSSAANDVYPRTPSFSFHGSTYSSSYVSLGAVETSTSTPSSDAPSCPPPGTCPLAAGGYTALDAPTADEVSLYERFDRAPYVTPGNVGAIPFLDFANTSLVVGATVSPAVLQDKGYADIASALSDPAGAIAKAVDGAANVMTAVICDLTNNQPAAVCSDPMIVAIERQMGPQNGPAPTGAAG